MKVTKLLALGLVFAILFTGCAQRKRINGHTYGIFTQQSKQNPNIEYEIVIGNIIWSIILIETIIAPIYFIGFSLYQPVSPKITDENMKGIIK